MDESEFAEIIEELKTIWKQLIEVSKMNNTDKNWYFRIKTRLWMEDLIKRRIELRNKLNRKQKKEEAIILNEAKNNGFPGVSGITLKDKVKWGVSTNKEFEQFYRELGDPMLWKVGRPFIKRPKLGVKN